jgi:iron complex transport system permease protein
MIEPPGSGRRPERRSGRLVLFLLACLCLGALAAAYTLTHGEPTVSLEEAWWAISGGPSIDETTRFVIRDLRLPRLIVALLAGAALALAGVILQDSLRNPIADPSLLGISEAAVLIVALTLFIPGFAFGISTPILALTGGLAAGSLIVTLARSIRDSVRLILMGAVLALLLTSVTTAITLFLYPASGSGEVAFLLRFTTGSVSSTTWQELWSIVPWLIVAIPLGLVAARTLNLLQLGDDVASGLGMRVTRARLVLFLVAMLMVAPVTAVTGPIAFVAFLCPHIARFVLRTTDAHAVLPAAAAVGGLMVLAADLLGRLVFYPLEIPAGVWTIMVGGPIAVVLAGRVLRASAPQVSPT